MIKKFFYAIIILVFVGAISISCKKDNIPCTKSGKIVGYDMTRCLCCPGWLIEVDNQTIKAKQIPLEITPYFDSGFPVTVILEYVDTQGSCAEFYKEIICMEVSK